ncbi:hypothetical protein Hamer_G003121 [Homarus americanus]|uniref:Secreted protein n=1 Tax=Homarus americanus TaxID=6706 RepID=A0A8J5N6P7_HOMAM|nr:hypothetical protein Hamer_G003121 [Homarus americanus]
MVNTMMSVSILWIRILLWPCCASCDSCSNMQLSASSCLHGIDVRRSSSPGLPKTPSPSVMTNCLPSLPNYLRTASNRNLKSSVLLQSMQMKLPISLYGCCSYHSPFPCFVLAMHFRESLV